MKRFAIAVLCLFLLSSFAAAADNAAASPAHKDTKFLLKYLKQTREDFLKSIKGVSPEQWKFKASPEKWSIAETAEHITLSEDFIRDRVKQLMQSPAATDEQRAKANLADEDLIKRVEDRSRKAQAPEPLRPTNKWASAKEIEQEFNKRREATMQYAKSTAEAELRKHTSPSPVGADLDAYQWLTLLAAHSKRHTLQIEEVKQDAGYPKK